MAKRTNDGHARVTKAADKPTIGRSSPSTKGADITPTIGRSVHYFDHGMHYAATVVYVHSKTCIDMAIFAHRQATTDAATGAVTFGDARPCVLAKTIAQNEEPDATSADPSWHWPERDE